MAAMPNEAIIIFVVIPNTDLAVAQSWQCVVMPKRQYGISEKSLMEAISLTEIPLVAKSQLLTG